MAHLPREVYGVEPIRAPHALLGLSVALRATLPTFFRGLATGNNAVLCIAISLFDGSVEMNGKVNSAGYALKGECIGDAVRKLDDHSKLSD